MTGIEYPATVKKGPDVYLTVDVEPDCPPFLWTWRGIEEGMPRLLDVFREENVPGTFFSTGQTAKHHPECINEIVRNGHELACHGYSHTSFQTMTEAQAIREISETNAILRDHAPVTSFRAPYLNFPERFVAILEAENIRTDASRARYKINEKPVPDTSNIARLEASVTSSVLRLPKVIRNQWFRMLSSPVTLFVHPWEFVDLTKSGIRLDCRFRTGEPALTDFRSTIQFFKRRGAAFKTVNRFQPAALADSAER